ncbi:DUF6056 family protein [Butyrivibrio sp. AE3003]|uniref:DUF6056 family protein n=1 Tax=Butyrivibrio sp. AE3003 TaxID=1496721 RepID=UPI00047E6042|nr:DUF6056 family protein [Butyrivibrio sp. AE3003]
MSEKLRKKIFYILMAVAFLSVLIYAFLTPNMSDDLVYWDRDDYGTKLANSFFDLFKLEYMHYLDHSGRNVAHFILRIFFVHENKVGVQCSFCACIYDSDTSYICEC